MPLQTLEELFGEAPSGGGTMTLEELFSSTAQQDTTPTGLPKLNQSQFDDPRLEQEFNRLRSQGMPDDPFTVIKANANLYGPNAGYEKYVKEVAQERGVSGQALDSFVAGEQRMAAGVLDLVPGVAEGLGYEDSDQWQQDLASRWQREANISSEVAKQSGSPFASELLFGGMGSLGQMIPTFGVGAAGLGYKAVMGTMTGTLWPDFYNQGKQKWDSKAGAAAYATWQVGLTMLTTVIGGKAAAKLGAKTFEEMLGNPVFQNVGRKVVGMAIEGGEEVAEDTLQKLTDYATNLNPEAFKNYGREEVQSFLIGSLLGAMSEVSPTIAEFVDRRSRSSAAKLGLPPNTSLKERNEIADVAKQTILASEEQTDGKQIPEATQFDEDGGGGEVLGGPQEGSPGVPESGQEIPQVPTEGEVTPEQPASPVEAPLPEQVSEVAPPAEVAPEAAVEPVVEPDQGLLDEDYGDVGDVDFDLGTIDPLAAARKRKDDAEQAKIDALEANRLNSVIAELEKRGDPDNLIPDLRAMPPQDVTAVLDLAATAAREKNDQRKSILKEWDTSLQRRKRFAAAVRKANKLGMDIDYVGRTTGIPYDEIINDVLQDQYNPELTKLARELGDGNLENGLFALMLGGRKAISQRFPKASTADALLDVVTEYSQKTGFVPPDTPAEPPTEAGFLKDPNLHSLRQAWLAADRAGLNLDQLPPAERIAQKQEYYEAIQAGYDKQALTIANRILTNPENVTRAERAGLLKRLTEIINEHSDLQERIKGSELADSATLIEDMNRLEAEAETISRAAHLAGSEKGRDLAFQKLTINKNYDVVSLLNEAKAAAGGKLTAKQDSDVRQDAKKIKEKEQDLRTELEKAADAVIKEADKLQRELDSQQLAPEIDGFAKKLAKFFVANGIPSRRALVDAVQKEIRKIFPEIRRVQVINAITGYGNFTEPSPDELAIRLRDLRGQLLQIAKLKDMAQGNKPKRTGPQRGTPSDAERRLIKQVNEAKKAGGFQETDSAQTLKTYLDSKETRLRNQIADLTEQIKTRKKFIKEKKIPPTNDEIERLIKERDELKAEYDAIFPKPDLTDEQRLELALKATQKSIDEYERRLREGDYSKPEKRILPPSAELDALRAERERLAQQYKESNPNDPVIVAKRKRLAELLQHLADGTVPDPVAVREEIKGLRKLLTEEIRQARKTLRMSEPAQRKSVEEQIKRLQDKLDSDELKLPSRRGPAIYESVGRLQYELKMLKREASQRIRDMEPWDVWKTLSEPFNLLRAVKTTGDFSAVGNQGMFLAVSHPVLAWKAINQMFSGTFSARRANEIHDRIIKDPAAPYYELGKLYIADQEGRPSAQEEVYRSNLLHVLGRVPYVGKVIQPILAFERSYVTFLNVLRTEVYKQALSSFTNGKPNSAEARLYAGFVNIASGRGEVGRFEQLFQALNVPLFAPRFLLSRVQYAIGKPLYDAAMYGTKSGNWNPTKFVAQEYARTMIGIGLLYALAKLYYGDEMEVEGDPRSSDFGKIRVGKVRLDPWAGLLQNITFAAKMPYIGTGERISAQTGMYEETDVSDELWRFTRMKLAPGPSLILNIFDGENVVGEEMTRWKIASDLTVPLAWSDVKDAMADRGVPEGLALQLLAIFGMRMQTY